MSALTVNCKNNLRPAHRGILYANSMGLKQQLKHAREHAKLSQSALARECGVEPSAINKLESGDTKNISGELLLRIADATGVDPFSICEIRHRKAHDLERVMRLGELFRKLPINKQNKMLHYLSVEVAEIEQGINAISTNPVEIFSDQAGQDHRET